MPVLRFAGWPHCSVYNGPEGSVSAGECIQASEAEAARLLQDFPGVFTLDAPEESEPETPLVPRNVAPAQPERDTAVKRPGRRRRG